MSLTSSLIRFLFYLGDRKRDKGLQTPENIVRHDNIAYGSDKKWNLLDVYLPVQHEGKLPVIINVHGGGWVYGTKETYQYYCMNLAQKGFAVVNFNYRLAPASKFPASLEDLNDVIAWVLASDEDYPIDRSRIYLMGDSAGAHLTAIYCCICTNPEYAKRFALKVPQGFSPQAVALNCGVYDMPSALEKNQLNIRTLINVDLLGRNANPMDFDSLNLIKHVGAHFPPTYLMTANDDFLNYQAPILKSKLEEYKIPYTYKIFGDDHHKLPHVFNCDIQREEAKVCNQEECDFFLSFT